MLADGLVSVVIPVRNGAAYLEEALRSVAAQTYSHIETIVVDDGSTDESAEIARRAGEGVRVVSQEAIGEGPARNRGATEARGEFLAWLDADDVWLPGKLDLQLEALDREQADLVFAHAEQFRSPELGSETRRFADEGSVVPMPNWTTLLSRTETWRKLGEVPAVRLGTFIGPLGRARRIGLRELMLPEVVARRRLHPASTTQLTRGDMRGYARVLKSSIDRRRAGEVP
jgi:glycosyltransferase involved in cell wall biosynthesis